MEKSEKHEDKAPSDIPGIPLPALCSNKAIQARMVRLFVHVQ